MPKFRVHLLQTVSAVVEIEAEDHDAAIEAVYDSPDMPGSMVHGAFGQASVDEDGEWRAHVVYDAETDEEVWRETP